MNCCDGCLPSCVNHPDGLLLLHVNCCGGFLPFHAIDCSACDGTPLQIHHGCCVPVNSFNLVILLHKKISMFVSIAVKGVLFKICVYLFYQK